MPLNPIHATGAYKSPVMNVGIKMAIAAPENCVWQAMGYFKGMPRCPMPQAKENTTFSLKCDNGGHHSTKEELEKVYFDDSKSS